ncbi:MAG: orotidine-5'-phosphate decarboxylase [Thermoplasmatota archaeon]
MKWKEKLLSSLERRTVLCVGLDTDMDRFPPEMKSGELPQYERNRDLIDATADVAAAYKLNQAFYEVQGIAGVTALEKTVSYITEKHPGILVILDAKKGDIGNTSKAYADAAFDRLGVDSITVNGYMGKDAVSPFSADPDNLVFVLCRTSNGSAGEVQDSPSPEEPFFMYMADLISRWNDKGNLGLVVGATYPEELKMVRERVGTDMPLLVPGIGAQGGDMKKVLEYGTDGRGWGVLINVSRGIMFAFQKDGGDFAGSARKAALHYNDTVRSMMKELGRW